MSVMAMINNDKEEDRIWSDLTRVTINNVGLHWVGIKSNMKKQVNPLLLVLNPGSPLVSLSEVQCPWEYFAHCCHHLEVYWIFDSKLGTIEN